MCDIGLRRATAWLVLACLLVVGCAQGGPATPTGPTSAGPTSEASPAQTITLNILHNWGPTDTKGPAMQRFFDDFMKANPDVKIVADIATDADIPTKVNTAFLAHQEPDIVFSNPFPETEKWLDSGVIISLDDKLKEWGLDGRLKDNALATSFYHQNGKLVALPFEGYIWPFWYNKKIFDAVGLPIPTTWDEIIADAPKLTAGGYVPVVAGPNDDSGNYLFNLAIQTSMTNDEYLDWRAKGKLTHFPNAVKAVEQFVHARDSGVFPKDAAGLQGPAINTKFYSGKAAIWDGGSWFFSDPPASFDPADVVLGGFPLTDGSAYAKPGLWNGFDAKGIWVTRNGSQKIDAVGRYLQFLYQGPNVAQFVEDSGMISPLKDTPVDPSKVNALLTQSMSMSETTITLLNPVNQAAGVDPSSALKDAWNPGTSATQIIKELDQAWVQGLSH